MFRNIRGSVLGKESLTNDEITDLVKEVLHGTLSMNRPDGYPKTIPITLYYDGKAFYFHCNKFAGEKLECLKEDQRVCLSIFTMEDADGSTPWILGKSAVAYGKAIEVEDNDTVVEVLKRLAEFSGMHFKGKDDYVLGPLRESVTVFRVDVEKLTSRYVPTNARPGAVEDFLGGKVKFQKGRPIYENS